LTQVSAGEQKQQELSQECERLIAEVRVRNTQLAETAADIRQLQDEREECETAINKVTYVL
jgi:chromosome segregation ATPase